jgi:hypothetical protein
MRELREFWKGSETTGGMRIGTRARVFKIVKTPVPLEHQIPEFQDVLGYEFYAVDPDSGRARELSQTGDPESQRLYWAKLDDLAHDMAELLESVDQEDGPAVAAGAPTERVTVYLAETTYDLREQRDAIRRELQGYDAEVLPDRPLPLVGPECREAVREQLARAALSIHLIGRNYGIVPEGETRSTVVLQNDLSIERGAGGGFGRLIWLPEDLESEDERQVRFIDTLQTDSRIQAGADILQTSLSDFKAVIQRRLRPPEPPKEKEAAAPALGPPLLEETGLKRIYLIFDQRDGEEPSIVTDFLFDQGFEVILPVFEGDEAQVRKDHEENLSICDAVLLYYGAGNELWLRAKLREVQKSAAFGRKKPITAKAVLVGPPDTPTKARFRTHEALVISQRGTFDPAAMQPFLSQLQAG